MFCSLYFKLSPIENTCHCYTNDAYYLFVYGYSSICVGSLLSIVSANTVCLVNIIYFCCWINVFVWHYFSSLHQNKTGNWMFFLYIFLETEHNKICKYYLFKVLIIFSNPNTTYQVRFPLQFGQTDSPSENILIYNAQHCICEWITSIQFFSLPLYKEILVEKYNNAVKYLKENTIQLFVIIIKLSDDYNQNNKI